MNNKKKVKLTNIYSRNILNRVRSPLTTFKRSKKVSLLNNDNISNPIYSIKKNKEKLKNIPKMKYSVRQNQSYIPSNERGSLNFAMKNNFQSSSIQDPWNLNKNNDIKKKKVYHQNINFREKKNTDPNIKSKNNKEKYTHKFLNGDKKRVRVYKNVKREGGSMRVKNYQSNINNFDSNIKNPETFKEKFLNQKIDKNLKEIKKEIRISNIDNSSLDNRFELNDNNKERLREKFLNENKKRSKIFKESKREIRGSIGANSYHSIDNRFGLVVKVRDNSKFKNVNLINKDFYDFKTLGQKTNPVFYQSADKRYKSCYRDENEISVDQEYSLHDEANQFRENVSKIDKQQIIYKSEKPLLEKTKVNVKVKDFASKKFKSSKKYPVLEEFKVDKKRIVDLDNEKDINLNVRNTRLQLEEVIGEKMNKKNEINLKNNTMQTKLQEIKVENKIIGEFDNNKEINLNLRNVPQFKSQEVKVEKKDQQLAYQNNLNLNDKELQKNKFDNKMIEDLHKENKINLNMSNDQKLNEVNINKNLFDEMNKEKDNHFEEIKSRAVFVKSSYDIVKVENPQFQDLNLQFKNVKKVNTSNNAPQFEMKTKDLNLELNLIEKKKEIFKNEPEKNILNHQKEKKENKINEKKVKENLELNLKEKKVGILKNEILQEKNDNIKLQENLQIQKEEENLLIKTENGYYKGDITNQGLNGLGIIYNKEKKIIYEGGFEKNEFHGHGTIYNNSQSLRKNRVDYRNFNFIEDNWLKYDGMFFNSLKCGIGYLYFKNEDFFLGEFKDDKINGFGVYKMGEEKIIGIWENNIFVKKV